jgi:ABC-type sugar transport system permease subunit
MALARSEKMTTLLPRKKHGLSMHASGLVFVWTMLAIPIVQFIIFWLVPNFDSLLMAFQNPNVDGLTFMNFQRFWHELTLPNSSLVIAIENTLIYFAVHIFIGMPIVVFIAFVLFKNVPGGKFFRVLFYLPSIVGGPVTAGIYRYLVSTGGPVEAVLTWMHIPFDSQLGLLGNPETAFLMCIIYSLWTGVGINMIMFYGALNRIPKEIFESAKMDGAGFWRQFVQIAVPLIWPTITTMLVFLMSSIFTTYSCVMLLCPETRQADMIGWYIVRYTVYTSNAAGDEILNYPAAVGFVFTLIGFPVTLLVKKVCEKISATVEY